MHDTTSQVGAPTDPAVTGSEVRRVNVRQDYAAFLAAKTTPGVRYDGDYAILPAWGAADRTIAAAVSEHAPHLHEYQRFGASFAVARKRAALYWEAGNGKTSTGLAYLACVAADAPALVTAPLAALHEWLAEAERFYPDLRSRLELVRTADVDAWLTNPRNEIALVTHHAFVQPRDLRGLKAVVCDEASILKGGDGAIARHLCAAIYPVPYRLALSATPAPNDPTEYATQVTWLGYMRSDAEFRARFFVHDGKDWRPKRHAEKELPRWLSRFALWMRDPAVYGMPCPAALPEPYRLHRVALETPGDTESLVPRNLIGEPVSLTMSERSKVRRALSADEQRTAAVVELAQGHPTIVWAKLNDHADALEAALRRSGLRVAQISGRTPRDASEDEDSTRHAILSAFRRGELDCLVSKPSVIGHGVNLQRCERMIFAAYDESYEQWHQAVRRAHRQGRVGALDVYRIETPDEQRIVAALESKQAEWEAMSARQEAEFSAALQPDLAAYRDGYLTEPAPETPARHAPAVGPWYELYHGDCVEVMADMPAESVDLSIFSPPFASLYTYSSEVADMGNCSDQHDAEFFIHFAHFAERLHRLMRPGRKVCVHLAQLAAFKAWHGRKGIRDFRSPVREQMEQAGFIYYGEFVIPKNPQAQAIRTKSTRLQFAQLERDSLELSPSLNDYVLEFRKPGQQAARVRPVANGQMTRDEWIVWASGVWTDIREGDVLSGWHGARGEQDEKHICPLQLTVIDRCVRLWSNPGETVFTPFLGIGSECYQAILRGRRGVGIELKAEYFEQAVANCRRAVAMAHDQLSLFDTAAPAAEAAG